MCNNVSNKSLVPISCQLFVYRKLFTKIMQLITQIFLSIMKPSLPEKKLAQRLI